MASALKIDTFLFNLKPLDTLPLLSKKSQARPDLFFELSVKFIDEMQRALSHGPDGLYKREILSSAEVR